MKQRAAALSVGKSAKTWKAQGQAVYNALTNTAKTSQASLRSALERKGVPHKPFWIVNTVKVTADAATIAELAVRSDVERIVEDGALQLPPLDPSEGRAGVDVIEWNIDNVRAPEAWGAFGTRGAGIVVGSIDTGVQYDHPALATQYRGAQTGTLDHNYNWFDPSGICGEVPCDNAGHGTHTMGTIVGDDGGDNQIGVAPEAQWISAKGCEDFSCSFEALLASGQWMLAPTDSTGANPRPDLRPNLVSNSWGGGGGDEFYREIVNAWVAAGIFPVFSNGNSGSSCGSSGSPGDYPESYSVGAYDAANVIADFSSRGASSFDVIKPNISAPGVNVRSALPGNDYGAFDGTSMAAPHVAGAVALLWSAAPAMLGDITLTREILGASALDREDLSCGGDAGNNNVWGEGQLDVVSALELAPIGPTGYLAGTVSDEGGASLPAARVEVSGAVNRSVTTNAAGGYNVRLPVGTYSLRASAFGYLPQIIGDALVELDATTEVNFALVSAPRFDVEGTVTDEAGLPIAGASVSVLGTPLAAVVTDETGYFLIPDVPEGSYSLRASAGGCLQSETQEITVDEPLVLAFTLAHVVDAYGYQCDPTDFDYVPAEEPLGLFGDDEQVSVELPFAFPLYGASQSSIVVSTNGYAAFSSEFSSFEASPIPSSQQPNGAIFGFWTDLVVDGIGEIFTETRGAAPNRQFVIEWRDVTFFADSQERVSFQILLGETGEIVTQYVSAETGPLSRGSSAAIGIENETGTIGLQYARKVPVIQSGMAVKYDIPFAGLLTGTVVDLDGGAPLANVTVTATGEVGVRSAKTDSAGQYRLRLPQGTYQLAASKPHYSGGSASVVIVEGETSVRDFALGTASVTVNPQTLQLVLASNSRRTQSLTLTNAGSVTAQFELREAGGRRQTTVSTAKLARKANANSMASTTKDLLDKPSSSSAVTPSATGDVLASFDTGLDLGWGIGRAEQLWLSDLGTLENFEYTVEGEPTGTSHPTPWAEWGADMAYDSARGLMCQVAVGGDNGVHCWDPATGDVSFVLTGSWSATSQRGLAYNPTADTFYVGGWNEGIVYQVAGAGHDNPGEVLSSCSPTDGLISGLAYNATMNVLWVATNSIDDTIYELNPEDCTVLSTLAPPQSGGYQGAGLELDPEGNLWVVAQSPNTVFLVESGVPDASDVAWLSTSPSAGELTPGASTTVQVSIDTAGLSPGLYLGTLLVLSNSASAPIVRVPVSLVVSGYLRAVNAGGNAYTDRAGESWLKDQAHRNGNWGYVQRGQVRTTNARISGTEDPTLYQSQRENPYAYRFDNVPNGVYQVELRFAEFERVRFGARLFDVIAETTTLLPAHDIQYDVGRNAADDHQFFVEVIDGRMDLRFVPRSGSRAPVINALRVVHRPDR